MDLRANTPHSKFGWVQRRFNSKRALETAHCDLNYL